MIIDNKMFVYVKTYPNSVNRTPEIFADEEAVTYDKLSYLDKARTSIRTYRNSLNRAYVNEINKINKLTDLLHSYDLEENVNLETIYHLTSDIIHLQEHAKKLLDKLSKVNLACETHIGICNYYLALQEIQYNYIEVKKLD